MKWGWYNKNHPHLLTINKLKTGKMAERQVNTKELPINIDKAKAFYEWWQGTIKGNNISCEQFPKVLERFRVEQPLKSHTNV